LSAVHLHQHAHLPWRAVPGSAGVETNNYGKPENYMEHGSFDTLLATPALQQTQCGASVARSYSTTEVLSLGAKMADNNKQNEFLYKISNSMRTGLADVQKYVNDLYRIDELEDYVGVKDSPIEYVQAALAPLVSQVNDFQDYAETVTGRMELNLEEVDIYAMLDGVMTIADQLVEDKPGVTLEDEIAEDLPTIDADAARLSQALLNYIHNAVKFTDKGYINIRVTREPNNILFEVRDTGIGIAEADQDLVFQPFETILADKDDSRLGFGLGLKIVEHIIDLHDGETWFESEAGMGSSFFFTIPI
jgi:two-component system sensor histidine kinase ChiS